MRRRLSGSTGATARRSAHTNPTALQPATNAAASTPRPGPLGDPASVIAYASAVMPSVAQPRPAQSIGGRTPLAGGPPGSARRRNAAASAVRQNGSAAKNSHRQPTNSASTPPAIVPTAEAAPATAPHTAKATARVRGSAYARPMSAGMQANITAPATPCTARPAMSQPTLGAKPASAVATVNAATPTRYTRVMPNASPIDPAPRRNPASATVYTFTTHCCALCPAPRSAPMLGRATVTIEV